MPTDTIIPPPGEPNDGASRVANAVRAFAGASRRAAPGGELSFDIDRSPDEAGGAALKMAEPLPIYAVDPRIEADDPLAAAARTGSRYLIFGVNDVHVADLPDDDFATPDLINSADLASRIVAASKLADGKIDKDKGYQARILDLNLLGNSVLWLKSDADDAPDRFFSLDKKPREIPASTLLPRITHAAQEKRMGLATGHDEAGG